MIFTFLPTFHSIAKPFKLNVVIFSIAIVSVIAVLTSTSKGWILAGMAGLGIYLVGHFFKRFYHAFARSTVFSELAEAVPDLWSNMKIAALAPPPDGLDPGTEDYAKKAHSNLLPLYLFSTIAFLGTTWLGRQISAKRMYIYLIVALAYTTVITVLVFALEFYDLSKVAPESFSVGSPSFRDFFSFSFANLVFSSVAIIKPTSGYAIALAQVQHFFSLLIGGFFVSILATLSNQRYTEDVNRLALELDSINREVAGFIEQSYALSLVKLEEFLIDFEPIMAKWLLRLRYGQDWQEVRQLNHTPEEPKNGTETITDIKCEDVTSSEELETDVRPSPADHDNKPPLQPEDK